MKRGLLLCFLLLSSAATWAQLEGRAKIESLQTKLVKSAEDTGRVTIYVEMSKTYKDINPDTGIMYGNKALSLAMELKSDYHIARSYGMLGTNYEAHADYPTALSYYIKSLAIFEARKDSAKIAQVSGNIGNIYNALHRDSIALAYATKTYSYYSNHRKFYKTELAEAMGNLGVICKDLKLAEKYYNDAIALDEEIHPEADIAKNLGNIATLYDGRDYPKAIELSTKAIAIYEKLGDKKNVAVNNDNIGYFYLGMATDTTLSSTTSGKIAKNNAEAQKNLQIAIQYFSLCINISRSIGYNEGTIDAYKGMTDAYHMLGDDTKALQCMNIYTGVNDSIAKEEKKNLAKVEAELRDAQEKERVAKIELQNARTRLYYVIGIGLLVVVIVVVVRYLLNEVKSNRRLAKERKKHIERIRAQKTVLQDIAYIQSHEVRGPVSTILGLTQLFNYDDLNDPTNKELMEGVATVAGRLDKIVTEVVNKENRVSEEGDTEADKEEGI